MDTKTLKAYKDAAKNATVKEMKDVVKILLAEKFPTRKTLKEIKFEETKGFETAEKLNFMSNIHAKAISRCCQKHQIIVTFRAAGENSIGRIEKGHPCKGHDILDKSIKEIADDKWTYVGDNLKNLAGFIGHSNDAESRKLDKIYCLNLQTGKSELVDPNIVTPGSDIEKACFTGDYDMHDLFQKRNRIVSDTVDENAPITDLNYAICEVDFSRKYDREKYKRSCDNPYSLIRHGAQTMYIEHLLSGKGAAELKGALDDAKKAAKEDQKIAAKIAARKKELQGALDITSGDLDQLIKGDCIAKIDGSLIAFVPVNDGVTQMAKIYYLKDLEAVYEFYSQFNLLEHVPFYNFFEMLKKDEPLKELIESYSMNINRLLGFHSDHQPK